MARRNTRRFLAAVLVWVVFATSALAAAAENRFFEEDPMIVRVGEITYIRSQIQPSLQSDINLARLVTGTYLTEEEQQAQKQATADRYVDTALIRVKLQEAGRNG